MPRPRSIAAVVLVLVLLLGACGSPRPPVDPPAPTGENVTPSDAPIPAEAREFYEQSIDWKSCEGGSGDFECGSVRVPLDWEDPGGRQIAVATIREAPEPGDRGTIWMNPGGPGGSGIETLLGAVDYVVSPELNDDFTIASFDPRGVNRSSPVNCLDAAELDDFRELNVDPATEGGMTKLRDASEEFAEACESRSGELLPFMGTDNAAKDLDVLRDADGDARLNYLGFSYGTLLGATYASLYPSKVGRFVLDGGVDPSLSGEELAMGQARGFEGALTSFIEYCFGSSSCPLDGSADEAKGQLVTILERAGVTPLPLQEGRVAGESLMAQGVLAGLYADESWDYLIMALQTLIDDNDASMLVGIADQADQRDVDGYLTNVEAANAAVNCLDYSFPSDPQAMRKEAQALEKAAPTVGQYLAYSGSLCGEWPTPPRPSTDEISAPGAAPMIVIGTTGDPATPYAWSESLARQLDASLLTYEGEGHTAYPRAGTCVVETVDAYFTEGTLPADGAACSGGASNTAL